jgi:hypothetical protein
MVILKNTMDCNIHGERDVKSTSRKPFRRPEGMQGLEKLREAVIKGQASTGKGLDRGRPG